MKKIQEEHVSSLRARSAVAPQVAPMVGMIGLFPTPTLPYHCLIYGTRVNVSREHALGLMAVAMRTHFHRHAHRSFVVNRFGL